MEEKLAIFNFREQEVRTHIDENGEPWFVAKDVCVILGIGNTSQAVSRLDTEDKNTIILNDGIPGNPNTSIISESGLYELVIRSDKPEAKKFRKWITSEVIPAIRKKGSYSVKKSDKFAIMRQMLDALEAQEKEIQRHEGEIRGLQMDVYKRDGYFSVAGYLAKQGRPCDVKTAAEHGRKLSGMCKKLRIETPKIDHPAFGSVNTYPEKMLDGYFGNGQTRLVNFPQ